MKRFRVALACGLLAIASPVVPARAQSSATTVLPKPPSPLRSALGTSVVPVVRPPAIPRRRRPRHHHHAATVAKAAPAARTGKAAAAKPASALKPPAKTAHEATPRAATTAATAAAATAAAKGAVASGAKPAASVPVAVEPPKFDPNKGTVTGLPLPRWVALRSDDVNLRSGPGTQYPIDWQYHRRNLPVRITREFEAWRLVTDPDGTKGWVHQATLTGRRGFMVKDTAETLRESADDAAKPVAVLRPGVVGYVRACPARSQWCELQAGAYRGWLKRDDFYGVDPDEAVN